MPEDMFLHLTEILGGQIWHSLNITTFLSKYPYRVFRSFRFPPEPHELRVYKNKVLLRHILIKYRDLRITQTWSLVGSKNIY